MKAKELYYLNPSICKECESVIHPKIYNGKYAVYQARIKKFCSNSCSAKYNNKSREKDLSFIEKRNERLSRLKNSKSKYKYNECVCGEFKKNTSKECSECRKKNSIGNKSYKYYKDKYSNWWSARVPISRNARKVYKESRRPESCFNCGYDKHIEICHIKAVSEFDENTLIKEINDINNLIALCPNCHWEFDNKLLDIKEILRDGAEVARLAHYQKVVGAIPTPAT